MSTGSPASQYRFGDFRLDVENRQLWCDDEQINLNARYFDALVLLVREHGQLVEKDQFFSEVWDDAVVSDAALTQCIKKIRKHLGDSATDPRYIETVPGYGYRFVGRVKANPAAEVEENSFAPSNKSSRIVWEPDIDWYNQLLLGGAGTLGGILAGLLGGLFYGFGLAYAAHDPKMGATSMLLVLISLNVIIGAMGGLGVSFGMVAAIMAKGANKVWMVAGAAFGGLLVGGLTKLLGVDAFNLLFGTAPEGITGGFEGAVLGGAVALGATLGGGLEVKRKLRPVLAAAVTSGMAGVLISIVGGRLMGGSLELLARTFTGSQLRIDAFGRFFGESHFGYLTQTLLSGIEGLLFGACVIGAMVYWRRLSD